MGNETRKRNTLNRTDVQIRTGNCTGLDRQEWPINLLLLTQAKNRFDSSSQSYTTDSVQQFTFSQILSDRRQLYWKFLLE